LPFQNRVTPFGELIATRERGTLTGNRGCLHDTDKRIRRRFVGKRWIHCLLEFKGRKRTMMTPGRYTELFFLDEATALAAGHRPCRECQRERFELFRRHWPGQSAVAIDEVLHKERLDGTGKRTYAARLGDLPEGVLVVDADSRPHLLWNRALRLWTPGGYTERTPAPVDREVRVLTPPSVVRAIAGGYPVVVHSSAEAS
jgi:hypothetical protein